MGYIFLLYRCFVYVYNNNNEQHYYNSRLFYNSLSIQLQYYPICTPILHVIYILILSNSLILATKIYKKSSYVGCEHLISVIS